MKDNQSEYSTKYEVEEIMKKLKNDKSPGNNGEREENLKYGGKEIISQLYVIIKEVCEEERVPKVCEIATIISILTS